MEKSSYNEKRTINFWKGLLFGAIFLLSLNQIAGSDTGFIISTGDYILQNLSIPRVDVFSLTANGSPWIAHFWLFGIILKIIESIYGYWGLIIFPGLISALLSWVLFKIIWLKKGFNFTSIILWPIFFLFTIELFIPRPQIISFLFIGFLLYFLEQFEKNYKNKKFIITGLLLFLLWANLHAGVVLGIILAFLFSLSSIYKSFFKISLFFAIGSLFVSLLNPYGYLTLIYSFLIRGASSSLGIEEWQSILSLYSVWQARLFLSLMIISALFIFWRYFEKYKNNNLNYWHTILTAVAIFLPLLSVRHAIFFSIIMFVLVSLEFKNIKININLPKVRTLISLILVFVFLVSINVAKSKLKEGPLNINVLPLNATNFIKDNSIEGPMFNLESGGFLMWQLKDQLVFFDNRNDVYSGQPLEDYLAIVKQEEGWQELFNEKYNINYAILWYQDPLTTYARGLSRSLQLDLDFKLIFWDDSATILIRNSKENQDIIEKFSYNHINPFRDPGLITNTEIKSAGKELERALEISPNSKLIRAYTQDFLRLVGTDF